jgi:hypothetical protein
MMKLENFLLRITEKKCPSIAAALVLLAAGGALLAAGGAVIYNSYGEKRILNNPICIKEITVQRKDTLTGYAAKIKKEDKEDSGISRVGIESLTGYIVEINKIKNHRRILYGTKIKLPRYSEKACN